MGTSKIRQEDDSITFETHLHIKVHEEEYVRVKSAANRAGLTVSEFSRRALHDAVLTMDRFFYVRFPNGTIHPPQHEVGYEFIENAQRFANRVNGKVIRAQIEPESRPLADRAGLGAGDGGGPA